MTPLRPWVKACGVILIVAGIALCAEAAFRVLLPDRVLDDAARATAKGERDLRARGRVPPPEAMRADVEPLNVIGLKTDAQIDAAFADPTFAATSRDSMRDSLRVSALAKGVFGLLFVGCGALVVRRRIRAAGWVALGLSLLGLLASIKMILGLDLSRAVSHYYTNTPLRLVELLGTGTLPIATIACLAIGWTPKRSWTPDSSPRPRRNPHQDIDDYYG